MLKYYLYNPKTKAFRLSDVEEEGGDWYLLSVVRDEDDLKELQEMDEADLRYWLWEAKVRRGEEMSVIDISLRHSRFNRDNRE